MIFCECEWYCVAKAPSRGDYTSTRKTFCRRVSCNLLPVLGGEKNRGTEGKIPKAPPRDNFFFRVDFFPVN
jgi:hypothetical protein